MENSERGTSPTARRATLADVAALAGVSKSAVSRVLSGTESTVRISKPTTERIHAAAKTLDYLPNAAARALGMRRTETIALIIPAASVEDHSDHRFSSIKLSELLSGIDQATADRGFNLIVQIANGSPLDDPRHAHLWKNGSVDGIIWLAMPLDERLNHLGCPVVAVNSEPDERVNASTINADHFESGRLATQHLINLGHTRIAHISAPLWVGQERERGYVETMIANGLTPSILAGDSFEESGLAQTREVLQMRQAPTAIFSGGDLMALGALRAALVDGVAVPTELALIGSDGMKLCQFTTPSISTVRMTMHLVGADATTMLIDEIERGSAEVRHVVAPTELVIRESCGYRSVGPEVADELAVRSLRDLMYPA